MRARSVPTSRSTPIVTGLAAAAGLLVSAAAALGQATDAPSSVGLTIYSLAQPGGVPVEAYRPVAGGMRGYRGYSPPGYAIVRETRPLSLPDADRMEARITGVAALIDPTTVHFAAGGADAPAARVLSQSFQFDLVDDTSLLQRFIDREVTIHISADVPPVTGVLLSASPPIVRHEDGRIELISGYQSIRFGELPEGLITRPTLVWDLAIEDAGPVEAKLSYETKGITWWADYNLVWTPGETDDEGRQTGTLDVGAWVSILNQSGASYRDAALKLIAGDVQRAQPPEPRMEMMQRAGGIAASMRDQGFEEQSFFEYHLYTLGRPATIPDNSTQQIELFPSASTAAEKELIFTAAPWRFGGLNTSDMRGSTQEGSASVFLVFDNREDAGLGIPLPKGRIRVFQQDAAESGGDGALEFIGEDTIDHTPRNETIRVRLGEAFDIAGERKVMNFQVDTNRKTMTETVQIEVRNRKQTRSKVIVRENLFRWSGWELVNTTVPWEKIDATTVHFPLSLDADETQTISYTVRYSW